MQTRVGAAVTWRRRDQEAIVEVAGGCCAVLRIGPLHQQPRLPSRRSGRLVPCPFHGNDEVAGRIPRSRSRSRARLRQLPRLDRDRTDHRTLPRTVATFEYRPWASRHGGPERGRLHGALVRYRPRGVESPRCASRRKRTMRCGRWWSSPPAGARGAAREGRGDLGRAGDPGAVSREHPRRAPRPRAGPQPARLRWRVLARARAGRDHAGGHHPRRRGAAGHGSRRGRRGRRVPRSAQRRSSRCWLALRANIRQVLETVTLAAVVADALPEPVLGLAEHPEAAHGREPGVAPPAEPS